MLVSVQVIEDLIPIPGADFIEVAQILGWQAIVKKGRYSVGQKIAYFEYNSLLPPEPQYSFLWGSDGMPVEVRIRTKKLKGVISQGLVLSAEELNLPPFEEIGVDLQETLKVKKFSAKIRNTGKSGTPKTKSRSTFPTHLLPKTDEVKLQSRPSYLLMNLDCECGVTQKLDGQSVTVIHLNEEQRKLLMDAAGTPDFRVCTRNQDVLFTEDQEHWKLVKEMGILDRLPAGLAVQGEFCGGRIQGNKMGYEGYKYFIYNVYDLLNKRYFSHKEAVAFCKEYDFPMVPVLFEGRVRDYLGENLSSALKVAEGKYANGAEQEGIVVRIDESTAGTRLSFKVISNRFLLKGGDDEDVDENDE